MNPTDYLTTEQQSADVKLSGRLQDISAEITQYSAKDTLTDIEARNFEELTVEFDTLEKQQEKLHRDARSSYIAKAAAKGATIYRGDALDDDPLAEPDGIEKRTFNDPWNLDEMRAYPFDSDGMNAELRARAKSAIEQMPGTTDQRRQAMTNMIDEFDGNGSFIAQRVLASSPDYLSFWAKRLRHGAEAVLTPGETQAVLRAMSLTDAEGGFLVPFQLDPAVILTADGSLNQIRQAARVVQATGDVWNGVSSAGVTFNWRGEAVEVDDDAPTFAQPSIPIYKADGFVPISIEALQDEINVTAQIGRMLAFGKDVHDAAAFATGVGTTQPIGIVTALVASSPTVIVTSSGADTVALVDVLALQNSVAARYRARASFLANNGWYNLVRALDTGGGGGFWTDLTADRPARLLNKAAYEAEDMDGVINGGAENYMAVFGDFDNYVIADRVGMTVETIPHLFAAANTRPTGERGFLAYYRVGADSVNDGAFGLLNVT